MDFIHTSIEYSQLGILSVVSSSVYFYMSPCTKYHSNLPYLVTIQMILDTTIARYHASKYKKQAPFSMRSPSNVPQLDKKEDTLKVIYSKYSKH